MRELRAGDVVRLGRTGSGLAFRSKAGARGFSRSHSTLFVVLSEMLDVPSELRRSIPDRAHLVWTDKGELLFLYGHTPDRLVIGRSTLSLLEAPRSRGRRK